MKQKRQVKKQIVFRGLTIKLYDVSREEIDKMTSGELGKQRNIEAFDQNLQLVWIIQTPTKNLFYFDMQIDEDNNVLEADSGAGEKYEINLSDGRIIRSMFIK